MKEKVSEQKNSKVKNVKNKETVLQKQSIFLKRSRE